MTQREAPTSGPLSGLRMAQPPALRRTGELVLHCWRLLGGVYPERLAAIVGLLPPCDPDELLEHLVTVRRMTGEA